LTGDTLAPVLTRLGPDAPVPRALARARVRHVRPAHRPPLGLELDRRWYVRYRRVHPRVGLRRRLRTGRTGPRFRHGLRVGRADRRGNGPNRGLGPPLGFGGDDGFDR